MQALKQITRVLDNHTINIALPENIPPNTLAEVSIVFTRESAQRPDQLAALRRAMTDHVFLGDLAEMTRDFAAVDNTDWE